MSLRAQRGNRLRGLNHKIVGWAPPTRQISSGNEINGETGMIEFIQINDTKHAGFATAMEIYVDAFPSNERFPVEFLKETIDKGLRSLYLGYFGDEVVFIAILWPLKDTEFILLDYIATKESYRGRGMGTAFMNAICKLLRDNKKFMLIEVENPEYGSEREEKRRRVGFYRRVGAQVMQGVRHVLPPLDGSGIPTEMLLMVFPEYGNGAIAARVVKDLLTKFYQEMHNGGLDNPVLNDLIQEIEDPIFLV
ncbi:MAG: GNAT family N-acetyltransferase [Hormoscilla sp.]